MLSNQNGNQAAQSLFQVLTEGPSVKITVSPPSPTTGQIVAFKFVSETAAYFQCRWDNVTASSIDDYANCTSPAYVLLHCLQLLSCMLTTMQELCTGVRECSQFLMQDHTDVRLDHIAACTQHTICPCTCYCMYCIASMCSKFVLLASYVVHNFAFWCC